MTSTGITREDGQPNRRTLGSGTKKAIERVESYQGGERGQNNEQQKQDKRLTETGEQGTSCPSSFTPQKAYHPHMHGPSYTDRQQCIICHDTSGSAGSPMTVSGVDTAGMPRLPHTPSGSATVEVVPILSEALQTTPPAPIPPITTSTDTSGACVI